MDMLNCKIKSGWPLDETDQAIFDHLPEEVKPGWLYARDHPGTTLKDLLDLGLLETSDECKEYMGYKEPQK